MNAREGERPLLELAQEVAGHMPGWTAMAGYHEAGVNLIAPDGSGVHLSRRQYETKISISGNWPQNGSNGDSYYPRESHSINVSRDRAPAQIAAEIKRRLLPAYQPEYARMVERKRAHEATATESEAFARELGDVLGKALRTGHDGGWSVYYGPGSFEVRRYGSIRFELSPDRILALKIATVVAAHEAAKPAESAE